MSTPDPDSQRRYRRRILGLGAIVLVVTFAIGSAIFIPVVQNDLKDRVEEELAEAGFAGVSVSFSGQDGTLTCADALVEPEAAEQLAEEVHGVRVIDLDRTCRNGASAASATEPVDAAPTDTEAPSVSEATTVDDTVAAETTSTEAPPATEVEADSIADIVAGDPLFSQLAGLVDSAQLAGDTGLGGDGPLTLFAPTDDAFDAAFDELGADAFNALVSDPDALRQVLLHHATQGAITSGDLVAGDVTMLDGTTVAVDPGAESGVTFTSGAVVAGVDDPDTQLDIEASNGVVHAINRLLIPDGLNLGVVDADAETSASLANGQLTLRGVVQSEEQRAVLLTAAASQVDPANVIDELTLDPDAVIDDADVARFAALVTAMPANLVDGEAVLSGSDLSLSGTYASDEGLATLDQLAGDDGIVTDLTARAVADEASAQALQDELNEFVTLNPVLFEPNSANLTPEANVVIEQIAARAASLDGTTIVIVGHTDSDGSQATNQTLSEGRSASVVTALVGQGLDAATLTSQGRGSTEPILDSAGVEDKAASRRVEFIVEAN